MDGIDGKDGQNSAEKRSQSVIGKHLRIEKERSTHDFESYLQGIEKSMNRDLRESDNDYSENRDVVKDGEFAANRINLFGM